MAARNKLENKRARRAERERNAKIQEKKRLLAKVQNAQNWFTSK